MAIRRDYVQNFKQGILQPCMDRFDELMKDIKEPSITIS